MNNISQYTKFKTSLIGFQKENFGLSQIEIVFSDLCNRTCGFCPRSVDYPNSNDNMSVDDAELIKERLIEFDYKGAMAISGKGEPLLNKNAVDCISKLKQWKPFLITNGDPLLKDDTLVERMFDAGLDYLIISEYDLEEKINMWYEKYNDYRIFVRNLIGDFNHEEANISNRGGALYNIDMSLSKICYLPFYKCVIDFDAKVQFCNNDWTYKHETACQKSEPGNEEDLVANGLMVLRWALEDAAQEVGSIENTVTSPFYVRGSYQVLSIEGRVGWHPEYRKRLGFDE